MFWNDVFTNIHSNNPNTHISIITRVKYADDSDGMSLGHKTISTMKKVA